MTAEKGLDDLITEFRQRLLAGEYGRYKLPSKANLMEQFAVSRETINRMVEHLQADGLLGNNKGNQLDIHLPRTRVSHVVKSFDGYLKSQGFEPKMEILEEPHDVSISAELAEKFGLAPRTAMFRRCRRQGTTTTPYRIAETYYLRELLDDEMIERLRTDPYFVVTEGLREKYGEVIEQTHDVVICRLPTTEEQQLLDIVRGAPILEIYRVCRSSRGTLLMATRLLLVASYFELVYDYATNLSV